MNITLIGMSGAGKSFYSERLSKVLGWDYIDVDALMENRQGASLQHVLDTQGEEAFTNIETAEILKLDLKENSVISPGGSVVYSQEAMAKLKEISKVIYLDVPFETIRKRREGKKKGIVGMGTKTLREVYDERIEIYEKYADETILLEGMSEEAIVEALQHAIHSP